jgi:GNAT superfamily N-acetyltransferase
MISVRRIELDTPEHAAALRLREAVLRAPLGLSWSEADLDDEPLGYHLAAFDGEALIATLMLKPLDGGVTKMRQVAVDPGQQGRGIGTELVAFAETYAREQGCRRLVAHARATALGFYRALGYTEEGEPFLENTIPHRRVSKQLFPATTGCAVS